MAYRDAILNTGHIMSCPQRGIKAQDKSECINIWERTFEKEGIVPAKALR